jgi:hypothetical protein
MTTCRDWTRALPEKLNFFEAYVSRPLTTCEVYTTYGFLLCFSAAMTLLSWQYWHSTHLSWHCFTDRDPCPTALAVCSCGGVVAFPDCASTDMTGYAGCACCTYSEIEQQAGILLYLSHLGGIYTACYGLTCALVAAYRMTQTSPNKEEDMTISLNQLAAPPDSPTPTAVVCC